MPSEAKTTGRAFGLTLSSDIDFPGLPPCTPHDAEVDIRRGAVVERLGEGRHRSYDEQEERAVLCWPGVSATVEAGSRITVDRFGDVAPAWERLFLLGPVAAALLRQRSILALHGSAVAIDGQAVGFIGWCGWGKSTTAAAFFSRGYGLVSDDLLAITPTGSGATCAPAYPEIRLSEEAVGELGLADSVRGRHPRSGKLIVDAREGFDPAPLALGALFALSSGDSLETRRLTPGEALPELLRHGFTARWLRGGVLTRQLELQAAVARDVPVFSIRVPRAFDGLGALMDVVLDHGPSAAKTA